MPEDLQLQMQIGQYLTCYYILYRPYLLAVVSSLYILCGRLVELEWGVVPREMSQSITRNNKPISHSKLPDNTIISYLIIETKYINEINNENMNKHSFFINRCLHVECVVQNVQKKMNVFLHQNMVSVE